MKISIINGPNLNALGNREPEVYGNVSFDDYLKELQGDFPNIDLEYYQSNIEGELINAIYKADKNCNAIILNAAGYSHTSIAIADAIKSISIPVVEVHISNIYAREEFRHISITGKNAIGVITGFGLFSYHLALTYLQKHI